MAVGFYERALQTYRQIPNAERPALGVEDRIESLREEMSTAGKNALAEMKRISVGTDIADLVEKARTFVRGKSPMGGASCLWEHSFRRESSSAPGAMRKEGYGLSSLLSFGVTHFSGDGRVVAKRSAITSGEPDSEAALRSEMVNMYQMQLPLFVQGIILPRTRHTYS